MSVLEERVLALIPGVMAAVRVESACAAIGSRLVGVAPATRSAGIARARP